MKKVATVFRATIKDDNGDTTYGPPESYAKATERLNDALKADWNTSGSVDPIA